MGFVPPARPAYPDEIVRYFEALAGATPRATLTEYARSHEGRPLVYLTVSSEANMAKLPAIREAIASIGEPRKTSAEQARRLSRTTPAIAWMAYSIHGDEISGSDASIGVAYRLVAGLDPLSKKLRHELVILIDPMQNPDGRHRRLAQITAFQGKVPDPDINSIAHWGFWPWGRGNHYLFDMNRDWFTLVHPESRGRVRVLAAWQPQMIVDAHEMGSSDTYLFSPPRHPFNPHLPPNVNKWMGRFGDEQAKAFDQYGWSYYTREWNEEFFPGYGSSWGQYGGAIAILYEQAGTDGGPVRLPAGTTMSYDESVAHHQVSSLANLETLASNREEILIDWSEGRRTSVESGSSGDRRAWVIPPGRDPARTLRMIEKLAIQGIEIQTNRAAVSANDLHGPWKASAREMKLPKGSFLIRLDQPLAPLVRNLFDFHQPMSAEFLRQERQWLERQKGTRLYETTAWALPYIFGVDAYWTGELPDGSWKPVTPEDLRPAPGVVLHPSASYGFVFDGRSDNAVFLAAALLERDVKLRAATEPFNVGQRTFRRGAFLVRRPENAGGVHRLLARLASEYGVTVHGLDTAHIKDGSDLGGNDFPLLIQPKIAMLSGDPISFVSYGAIWHLLDTKVGVRFSGLDVGRVSELDLAKYNVLVVPNIWGGAAEYRRRIGPAGMKKLEQWVKAGGTLIGIGGGASFLADKETKLVATRPRHQVLNRYPPVVLGLDVETAEQAGLMRAVGLRAAPPKKKDEKPLPRWPHPDRPYDVPPMIGSVARAFLPQGTPVFAIPKTTSLLTEWGKAFAPAGEDKEDKKAIEDYLERADSRLQRFHTRGAHLTVDLDPEHWLAYGSPTRIAALFHRRDAFVAESPAEVAGMFADLKELHVSGLLWPEAAGRIARTAYVTRESVGRGQVILFAGDPVFRASAWPTQRLFLNAVVMGPGLGTQYPDPW